MVVTSEEVREKRRIERKQFKIDRAQAIAAAAAEAETIFQSEGRVMVPAVRGPDIPSAATWRPTPAILSEGAGAIPEIDDIPFDEDETLENLEHLQLSLSEAFFLAWNLDCLTITDNTTVCKISFHSTYSIYSISSLIL
jgi:tRNA-splicing endonuclease subunit Sen2